MDYATLAASALRRPGRHPANPLADSVMASPSAPEWEPEYVKEPPLEQVSPEDFIPNPKTVVAALKGLPMIAGTFIGPKSALWDPNKAAAAGMRLQAGEQPASVWKALMTGKLPEGPMAQEISDVGTDIDMRALAKLPPKTFVWLRDVAHGPMFDAYPHLKAQRINIDPSIPGRGRYISYKNAEHLNSVSLNPSKMGNDPDLPRSTLLHELGGHAVQHKEGWTPGGSAKRQLIGFADLDPYQQATYGELLRNAPTPPQGTDPLNALKELLTANNQSKFAAPRIHNANVDLFNKILADQKARDAAAFRDYRNIYGEAMARLIQGRAGHLKRNLSNKYPFDPEYFQTVTGSAIDELRKP